MKVGDLVKEVEYPEIAVVVTIDFNRTNAPYCLLCPNGDYTWFSREYVEDRCEVVSESR